MAHLVREPLVHFIALALAVFALFALAGGARGRAGEDRVIRLTGEAVERMAALYASEAGTLPDDEAVRAMVADHVREVALAREARRLGLDEGDTIIERRLAQKMQFLLSDRIAPPEPGEAELRAFHAARQERYTAPERVTFQHVFLAEAGGDRVAAVRAELDAAGPGEWRALGDVTMVRREWGEVPLREVTRQFGRDFTAGLAALEPGPDWQGPVPSAFGEHLVRLTDRQPAQALAFEAVREDVRADWIDDWRRQANAEAVAELVSRYRVELAD